MSSWMIGVDTGGTFTDLVAINNETGEIQLAKVPSYPPDPSKAVLNAVQELIQRGIAPSDITFFAHGTTVGTNALLEADGAKTGLVITRGFRATYEARGWIQPTGSDLVDTAYQKPPLLVPQFLTEEASGRMSFEGEEVAPLDEVALRESIRTLQGKGVEAIAICFLFSFLNPEHELRAAEIAAEEAPNVRISVSSTVLPMIREYPRLSTTVVDAYVGPKVEGYLHRLSSQLSTLGVATPQKFLMQSNGGLMRINIAARHPNQTLLSGPAAGVIAATNLARFAKCAHVLTFDMGGTSTDIGIIVDGKILESTENQIAGHDIGTPMLEIRTLGAGGGTVASIGKDGLLKVGPRSSGSMPGPVCYGRGGNEPTVTDANLILGSLSPKSPLAGSLRLDEARARECMHAKLAALLDLSVLEAAAGIVRIVNTQMAVDLRSALREQGQDPRLFTLMAFGGAGPLHACYLARATGVARIWVPVYPGINCATGLLQTSVRHSYLRSVVGRLGRFPIHRMTEHFRELERQARNEAADEGFDPSGVKLIRQMDLRYPHQGYTLAVECPPGDLVGEHKALLKASFDTLHRQVYGQAAVGEDPELATFRVTSEIAVPRLNFVQIEAGDGDSSRALTGERHLYDVDLKSTSMARVYSRKLLMAGDVIEGPAIVDQFDSTTVILSDFRAHVDPVGTLSMHRI
jgi:N-methylhydantoinase A